MIITSGINKSFGDLQVLKDVSLEIKKGEIVSIVGASGAGKTTLLQIMGTLSSADSGTIEIAGERVDKLNDAALSQFRNRNIGFVFQFHHLLPEFSALENICIPGYIAKRDRAEVMHKAKELIELLGMQGRMHHKPAEMSGGEQQRIAIARALINSPSVILADEPSGNLDSKNRDELNKLFLTLRDTLGQTIVIVTHDTLLAEKTDRQIVMSDGVIL